MSHKNLYNAYDVMNKAANDNTVPRRILWQRLLKISICVAPLVAWLLWAK